jgi:hypothetical protein
VICLEAIGGDETPGLIVDEALDAIGPATERIEQDDCEDERLLKRCLHDRILARVRSYKSTEER